MELLEREQYLAELRGWLASVAEQGGCIALVGGEAGLGKSALLHSFAGEQRAVRVLWGACDALFTPRPLAPLLDIAQQAQGELLRVVSAQAPRDAIFAAALNELEREPALVVFEDMHWADEATLDLLKFIGRRIQRTRALLAISYRNDEVGAQHPLRFVIGDLPRASTRRMTLAPLTESAVAQLARESGRTSKDLHAITGGNPFFVTEVLASPGDTVPATVRDAVLTRTLRIPAAVRELAEFVCVLPGKAEGWLLEQAALTDEHAVEGCLRVGMQRHDDGALAFRHELARCALEESLTPLRTRSLHARVLALLRQRPGVAAARLAHHADGAGDAEAVLRFAPLAAAQAASVSSHREAVAQYQRSLRYAHSLPTEEHARLEEQLAYECYLTGQYQRAIHAISSALAKWRELGLRVQEGAALRWLSRLSWYSDDRVAANRYAIEAVTTLEALPPTPELAMAYCNRGDLDTEDHDVDAALVWTGRAIALAERWGKNEILSHALECQGLARLVGGDAGGWNDLERSLQLALAGGYQELVNSNYTNLAAMAVSCRMYERAAEYLSAGLAYCDEHELDFLRPYMLAYRARLKFEQADWHGASLDVEAALRHPRSTAIARIPALRTLAHLRIRRGDPDAKGLLDEVEALGGPAPELQRIGTLAAVRAEAAWLADDRPGVIAAVMPAYRMVLQRRDPRMRGELAAWLWRVGALERPPPDIAEPYGLEISGDWCSAARSWQQLGCPYEHACLLAWHGAEAEQREALQIFEQLGAGPAAAALRRRMRVQGIQGIPRGSRTSTRKDPHGLTRREAEILALLSQGLRNAAIAKRLFVSAKTVDHHVSAILTKLEVQSRAEAIAKARRQSDSGS